MKKPTKRIDWTAVARKMAEDKRRIEAAIGSTPTPALHGITFVHPFALPADRS